MHYCVNSRNSEWIETADKNCKMGIIGYSDSDKTNGIFVKTRRSITGYSDFLNGAPLAVKSKLQGAVTLSVTEAESWLLQLLLGNVMYDYENQLESKSRHLCYYKSTTTKERKTLLTIEVLVVGNITWMFAIFIVATDYKISRN
jgi:hypothetical protein